MSERPALPPRRALLVLFGCLMCQLGTGFFYGTRALAPDVIADLGWTRTMWSSAMAPMLLVSSLAQAVVGNACVRFGVRTVLVGALLCLGAALTTLASMTSLWQFYVAVVLLAVGSAGVGDVTIGAVITRWFERSRGPALGFALIGSNLGAVIFVQVVSTLSGPGSWRQAALQMGIGGVAVILPFAHFAVRDPQPGEAPEHTAPAENSTDDTAPAAEQLDLSQALRRPGFWLLFYVLFCYAFAQLGMVDHLILYLMDLGHSRSEAAGVLQMTVGAGILAKLCAGFVALRMRARTALLLNTGLLASALALLPFAEHGAALAGFGLLFGISTAARDVFFPLVVAERYGTRAFAALFGVLMMAFFPGGALGPLGLAAAHDVLGSYGPAFTACLSLVVAAIAALWVLPRVR